MNVRLALAAVLMGGIAVAADITVLPRDAAAEEFVRHVLMVTDRDFNIQVVKDETTEFCGYATTHAGQHFIALNPACVGARTESRKYSSYDVAVIAHEIGHVVRGHTLTSTDDAEARRHQLEADEFGGLAMALLGGSLTAAQAHAATTGDPPASERDPSRAARMEAVADGWGQGSVRMAGAALPDQYWEPDRPGTPFRVHWTSFILGALSTFVFIYFLTARR